MARRGQKRAPPPLPTIELHHTLKPSLAAGHPWLYRNHLPRHFQARSGAWVRATAGNWVGYALYDADSPIALRIFSTEQVPDARWVAARIREAWALRAPLRERGITAYRWLFGEGDGLPGLTVDLYGEFAVILTYADSLGAILPWVVEGMRQVAPLRGILLRDREEGESKARLLWGELPPQELIVEEYGIRLLANLHAGQKSGLFLDHRENRHWIGGFASGKRVLNLFAYSGAFSLHALAGGARHVTSVDMASAAIADAGRNVALNGFDPARHEGIVADVFDYLEQQRIAKGRWELVICDPPSFARSREQLPQAIKAYQRVNAMGMRVTEEGGLYAAASCTSQVSPEAFRDILAEAARQAKVRFQIIHDVGHALDHPVLAAHPEGRYLKFVVGRVSANT